ncbi:hypothetical protein V5799_022286, partial [Amblyomma americanum]
MDDHTELQNLHAVASAGLKLGAVGFILFSLVGTIGRTIPKRRRIPCVTMLDFTYVVSANFITLLIRWRQTGVSFSICGAHFLHLVAVITDIMATSQKTEIIHCVVSDFCKMGRTIDAVLLVTVSGCFLLSGCQDTPEVRPSDKK